MSFVLFFPYPLGFIVIMFSLHVGGPQVGCWFGHVATTTACDHPYYAIVVIPKDVVLYVEAFVRNSMHI